MASKKAEIIHILKKEILTLTLTPGTVVSEMTLTERFSLSRTPIRDILKQLSAEGYIDIYPQRGSIVSYIDLESVEQIIYMRSTMEKDIIKSLGGNVPLQGIHQLGLILDQQQACIDNKEDDHDFFDLDDQFHKLIYSLAGHEFIWDMMQQFIVHYTRYRRLHMLKQDKRLSILDDHRRIKDYLVSGHEKDVDEMVHHHLRADVKSKYFQEHFSDYIKK